MGHSLPAPRARPWFLPTWFMLACGLTAGCAHRDVIDTPVGWWHQLEGGAIAQQRPPPPGVNDPYPHVGTVPAKAPTVASLDLRRSVTGNLLRQRNLDTRLNANDPLPPPVPRPPAKAAPGNNASATLDAAQAPPATAAKAPEADSEPELALPAVQILPAAGTTAVTLPEIPGAPPAPPRLPGLSLAAGLPAHTKAPDYAVAPVAGVTSIAFAPGTDSMMSGQQGVLHALAMRRGAGKMLIRGEGDAAAPDPQAQAQALTVASLRARAVAHALLQEGVPPGAILLRAEAFGRGAAITVVQ